VIPPGPAESGHGPGIVTALEPDPRRAGTVRVDVDEQRFASVPAEVALAPCGPASGPRRNRNRPIGRRSGLWSAEGSRGRI
jgi:hypothetical protein